MNELQNDGKFRSRTMADIEDKYLFKIMLKKIRKIDLTFNNE